MNSSRTRIEVKEDVRLAVLSFNGDQNGHVMLTAAPDHQLAAAVSGSYRGTGVGIVDALRRGAVHGQNPGPEAHVNR
jgi:hypothetical protein